MSQTPSVSVRWNEDLLGAQTTTYRDREWLVDIRVAAQVVSRSAEAFGFSVTMTAPNGGRRLAHVGAAPSIESAKTAAVECATRRIDSEAKRRS